MVVAGIGSFDPRGRHSHPMQPEMNRGFRANDRAILEIDKFDLGAGRRRRTAAC